VVYRSREARLTRLALGVVLAVVTGWIVAPVLGTDHAPPPPVGLAFASNFQNRFKDPKYEEFASTINMTVRASGCVNPVTIEGQLVRSQPTWEAEAHHAPLNSPPHWAALGLAGAHVRALVMGVVDPYDAVPQPITGTAQVGEITVHAHLYPAVEHGDTTTATYSAPQWPLLRSSLNFVIAADLIHPAGFHSCYLDLPEPVEALFTQGSNVQRATVAAGEALERTLRVSHRSATESRPEDIAGFQLTAYVNGRVVAPSTIGESGRVVGNGVHYQCYAGNQLYRPPVRLDPQARADFAVQSTPGCVPVPLFQAVDVTSDTTRRLFVAGIIGAIAATLIIEAGFLGETEPAEGSASQSQRRWRRSS
jgi:hypothetical protein